MKSPLIYLLQVVIVSGVLYGYYHLFLRNKTCFHQYNRFYLLIVTLVSLIIPILTITIHFSSRQDIPAIYQLLSTIRIGEGEKSNTASRMPSRSEWVQVFYWSVTAFILIRFSIALLKLRRLLHRYHPEKTKNILFFNTDEEGTPYSFLHWLFWNKKIPLNTGNGQKIFRHELFHIQQKHSWDILYLELLICFCWINPFFHLIKKEIKATHEFLADQYAAGHDNRWEYAELLIMQVFQTRQQIVNPFFHNQIKRRIAMITNPSNTSYQYLRKTMALALVISLITLISMHCTSKDVNNNDTATVTKTAVEDKKPGEQIFEKVEIEPVFPGAITGWRTYLQKNLNAAVPVDKGAPEGEYTVTVQFIVNTSGKISDLKALTHHGFGMEEEVLRIMAKSPDWEPAVQDGRKVNAYRRQPVTFAIQAE